jgi:hypothetical protein
MADSHRHYDSMIIRSTAGSRHPTLTRAVLIGTLIAAAFLLGFVPQWLRSRSLDSHLAAVRHERTMLDLGGRLGAALAEAQRGNYERARQLMTGFFSELQGRLDTIQEPGQREAATVVLRERDEIITLLSRAEPEAVSRLNLLYTRYFSAFHPTGRTSPTAVTPSPPP